MITLSDALAQARDHYQAGNFPQAERLCHDILQHDPEHALTLNLLGMIAYQLGQYDTAMHYMHHAIAAHPEVASFHSNLGLIMLTQEQAAAAENHLQAAVYLEPNFAEAHNNLGNALQAQGEITRAVASYQAALRAKPDFVKAHYNLGNAMQAQGEITAAITCYQEALRIQSRFPEAHYNLGNALEKQGNFDPALACYDEALALQPDFAEAHWARAIIWLRQGNLTQGWAEYEWRFRLQEAPVQDVPSPRWDGTSLAHRTIRVHAEQGVGDELLFASCFPELMAQAGHCVIACDARLLPLFTRSFSTATIVARNRGEDVSSISTDLPSVDIHTAAGSLPRYLRPTLASFPTRPGYLVPDHARRLQWQRRLAALGTGLKVGIAWRSRATRSERYYTRLTDWGTILTVPGIHWVNVQYDEPWPELSDAQRQFGVCIRSWRELDLFNDFDEAAALLAALDLVIAPEMTMGALAAGVGTPVWQLMTAEGSWPMLGTDAQPWFPTMRVFRQPQHGDWNSVLREIARSLPQYQRWRSRSTEVCHRTEEAPHANI